MAPSDMTGPTKPKRRPRKRPAHSTNNNRRPADRNVDEDVTDEVEDKHLYLLEPDNKLQHRVVQWVGLTVNVMSATVCVVAIAAGSVPTALVTAIAVLATTILLIVQRVFPRCGKRAG